MDRAVRVKRAAAFGVSIVAVVLAAETLARVGEPLIQAASHRALFKLELLQRRGPTEVVFVGTSRLNDGVAPDVVTAELGWSGFNASVPSASLRMQRYLAERAASAPGVRALVLELSTSLARERPLDPELTEAPAGEKSASPLRLARHRRAFTPENLLRIGALLAGRSFDGSEWFRDRWLTESLREVFPPQGTPPPVEPRVHRAGAPPGVLAPDWERWVAGYEPWVPPLRERVQLFFVVPPAAGELARSECGGELAAFASAVARRTGVPVLDFSCFDDEALFSDRRAHLGAVGRQWFSKSLGRALLQALAAPRSAAEASHAVQ